MNLKRFIACTVLTLLLSAHATADLLIYPVRVSFDETERSATLTLTNTSSKTNTYRLAWSEKRALSGGGYQDLTEEQAKETNISSSMLRFSPRQVTLKPRERQMIKLVLRRPRDLAEGEYRSHLLFKAVGPESADNNQAAQNTGTSISIVLSFAVPITVQQGNYDTKVLLKDATISYDPSTGLRKVGLSMERKGAHSASGDLSAFWTPTGGKEILLAKISDYNLWSELDEGTPSLISTEESFTPGDGLLRIEYQGVRDFSGNTYLNETVEMKRNQIVIEPSE